MKTLRSFITLSLLFAAVTAGIAQSNLDVSLLGTTSATVLLSDNFPGTSVDSVKWDIAQPWSDSAVTVSGATATSHNRGYLISKDSFTGDLEINCMVKLIGSGTSASIVWKTDGTYTNQDLSTTPTRGLQVGFYHESQTLGLAYYNGSIYATNWSNTSMALPLDTWISVRIVDQGGTVSVYVDGSTTPVGTLAYDPTILGTNGKVDFFSRESRYCGSVGAGITALMISNLTPAPTEMVVTITEPATLAAIVTPDEVVEPTIMKSAAAVVDVPTVTVTDAGTGEVVATDVVLTGDIAKDSKHFSDRHRKAYGVKIAQHNRLKGARCATSKKLPAGIYVFTFQQKSGAKNCKFNATIVRVDDNKDECKNDGKKGDNSDCGKKDGGEKRG